MRILLKSKAIGFASTFFQITYLLAHKISPTFAESYAKLVRLIWRFVTSTPLRKITASINTIAKSKSSEPISLTKQFKTESNAAPIYFFEEPEPTVSIVVPIYQNLADLEDCLRSIAKYGHSSPKFEVIAIDDCPESPVLNGIPSSPGLRKLTNIENLGFLKTCNLAAEFCRGEYICFLNSDTIVTESWLAELVDTAAQSSDIGIVGSTLLNDDGTIQDAGWRILQNGWGEPIGRGDCKEDSYYGHTRTVDCVTGASLLIKTSLFREVGGFDEEYAPAFYEEFELSFRLKRRGFRTVVEPKSLVIHKGSASYGEKERNRLTVLNHSKFVETYARELGKQPFFLTNKTADYSARNLSPTILIVDHSVPDVTKHAGDRTISHMVDLFLKDGKRVIFFPFSDKRKGENWRNFQKKGILIAGADLAMDEFFQTNNDVIDEILVCRPEIATEVLPIVKKYTNAPVVYYTHDLHFLRLEKQFQLHPTLSHKSALEIMRNKEVAIFCSVDKILSPSEEEARIIRALTPDTEVITVNPYFYEKQSLQPRGPELQSAAENLLFVGGFPHEPNVDAALFAVNEIMPLVWKNLPDLKLFLVGYKPPAEVQRLASENVIVTGHVPDLEPYYKSSRIFISPLRFGAGVKGKILEAFSFGLPVIGTRESFAGLENFDSELIPLAETPEEFAEAIISLYNDPVRLKQLGEIGLNLVMRDYSEKNMQQMLRIAFPTTRCILCGSKDLFAASSEAEKVSREEFSCKDCFALGRSTAVAKAILDRYSITADDYFFQFKKHASGLRIHSFGFSGALPETLYGLANFSSSDYANSDISAKALPEFVDNEDLQNLTYPDDVFDISISEDVLEHVPDPRKALSEIKRTLKPGGRHFFTIPQNKSQTSSVSRAIIDNGSLLHLLKPHFHGDPLRIEGALVFTDFGADLPQIVEESGLIFREHRINVAFSNLVTELSVFEAEKPGN